MSDKSYIVGITDDYGTTDWNYLITFDTRKKAEKYAMQVTAGKRSFKIKENDA